MENGVVFVSVAVNGVVRVAAYGDASLDGERLLFAMPYLPGMYAEATAVFYPLSGSPRVLGGGLWVSPKGEGRLDITDLREYTSQSELFPFALPVHLGCEKPFSLMYAEATGGTWVARVLSPRQVVLNLDGATEGRFALPLPSGPVWVSFVFRLGFDISVTYARRRGVGIMGEMDVPAKYSAHLPGFLPPYPAG